MSNNQLDLLAWKPRGELIPFPFSRSHGATAGMAKTILGLDRPARTGKLNSIRAQTRRMMEPLFGKDRADRMADDLLTQIKLQLRYREVDRGMRRPDEA